MIEDGLKVREVVRLLEIPTSTIYYLSTMNRKDSHVMEMIRDIAFKYPFYGYRRIYLTLKKKMQINKKKVYRIYRLLNLQRYRPKRRKRVCRASTFPLVVAHHPNRVWTMDILFDTLSNGRTVKFLPCEDIFTRFSIGIETAFSITSDRVVECLEIWFKKFGLPKVFRTDQGPEFIAKVLDRFLSFHRVKHEFIEKASPWQDGHVESFIGKFRDECLHLHNFQDIDEARKLTAKYRKFYNHIRPHSGLGGCTPYEKYPR